MRVRASTSPCGDAAGVGAQDAAGERGVLVVLPHPPARFGVKWS